MPAVVGHLMTTPYQRGFVTNSEIEILYSTVTIIAEMHKLTRFQFGSPWQMPSRQLPRLCLRFGMGSNAYRLKSFQWITASDRNGLVI